MRQTTKGLIAIVAIVAAAAIFAALAAADKDAGSDLATRTPTELGQRVHNYSLSQTSGVCQDGDRPFRDRRTHAVAIRFHPGK